MVETLMAEIRERTSVLAFPLNERIVIYPVVLDEDHSGLWLARYGKELADMGLVFYVSYGANREQLELLRDLENRKGQARSSPERRMLREQIQAIQDTSLIEVGDVVGVNQYAGLDVPGTHFIAIHREDVVVKIRGMPVRLWAESDRPDEGLKESLRTDARAAEAGIEKEPTIVTG